MLVNQCSLVDDLIALLAKQGGVAAYEQIGSDLLYLAESRPFAGERAFGWATGPGQSIRTLSRKAGNVA